MKKIEFSCNWNNKLDCNVFSTLRLTDRFEINDIIEIHLKKHLYSTGQILKKKGLLLKQITDYVAYLDTGYNAIECKNILMKMYKNIDWSKQIIYVYFIKNVLKRK